MKLPVRSGRKRLLFYALATLAAFLAYEGITSVVAYTADAYVRSDLVSVAPKVSGRIVANYRQSYVRRLRVGQTAWVWLDSEPGRFHRARIEGIGRGISRDPGGDSLLPYVAPTTDWLRLQRRFAVTLVLTDPPDMLFMGADARSVIFPEW